MQYSSLNRCAPSRCVRGVACRQLGRVAGHDAVTGRSGNPFWSPAAEVNAYLEFGAVLRRITPCSMASPSPARLSLQLPSIALLRFARLRTSASMTFWIKGLINRLSPFGS